jgi:hypothetical protein
MSRYVLLLLINLPFILVAIVSQITRYKMKRSSKRRLYVQMLLWFLILGGLITAEPLYTWLFARGLTQTDSLSLFDVVQITAIVIIFFIANQSRQKIETLERRLQDLHQEVSIRLSEDTRKDNT